MKKATNILLGIVIAIAFTLLWRGQSRLNDRLATQTEEYERTRAELEATRSELAKAQAELDFFKTGDISRAARPARPADRPVAATAPVEEKAWFILQPPTVEKTSSGLLVRLRFEPTEGAVLPGRITLVARVPETGPARLMGWKPAAQNSFADLERIIHPQGLLAMVEGAPADLSALDFELEVSGPATATVRGSEGIRDFELTIGPDECSVREL